MNNVICKAANQIHTMSCKMYAHANGGFGRVELQRCWNRDWKCVATPSNNSWLFHKSCRGDVPATWPFNGSVFETLQNVNWLTVGFFIQNNSVLNYVLSLLMPFAQQTITVAECEDPDLGVVVPENSRPSPRPRPGPSPEISEPGDVEIWDPRKSKE